MTESKLIRTLNRRGFLTGIVPACAMTCLGAKIAFGTPFLIGQETARKSGHKFDQPLERQITWRQLSQTSLSPYILLAKELEKEMGRERMLKFIEDATKSLTLKRGKALAQQSPDVSLASFTKRLRRPELQNNLTMEILEDTAKVFEFKVTECLVAETFRDNKDLELGNAAVCIGDFTMAEGFNPKIRLIRDKTLTLGHPYCNHRYIWQD